MNYLKDFENFNLNEELHIDSKRKLRDAIHEIVINNLDYGEEMKIDVLSNILKDKYNIFIKTELLKKLVFNNWWNLNKDTLFREKDKKWLDIWQYRDTIERKKLKVTPSLGKSRRKIEKEERLKNNYSNYGYNYGGNWKNTNKNNNLYSDFEYWD